MKLTKAERLIQQAQRARQKAEPKILVPKTAPMAAPTPRQLAPVPIVEWTGMYDHSWKGELVDEAFAHPAKAARRLLHTIFNHLFNEGILTKGSLVVDPFGGIGTTGIIGAYHGCRVICSELEPKFVELTKANFAKHTYAWTEMGLPIPVVVQGDSRQLRRHIQSVADAVVSSPPYADLGVDIKGHGIIGAVVSKDPHYGQAEYGKSPGQLGDMKEGQLDAVVSSPPYAETILSGGGGIAHEMRNTYREGQNYGDAPGQLGAMKDDSVDAVVSSPPYAEIAAGAGGLNTQPAKHDGQQAGRSAASASQDTDQRYGESEGQLARMEKGEVDVVLSSPPYADIAQSGGDLSLRGHQGLTRGENAFKEYGTTPGQLGVLKEEGVSAIISSPPFGSGDSASAQSISTRTDKSAEWVKANCGPAATQGYGESEGQMAEMGMKTGVDAVVTSPPYNLPMSQDHPGTRGGIRGTAPSEPGAFAKYGSTDGQIDGLPMGDTGVEAIGQVGAMQSDTFWTAARDIVRECYLALKPGGYAVWIVKAFVRNKQIVDFPADWRKLCEYVGLETLTEVHAMLVKYGAQHGKKGLIEDDDVLVEQTERKSFFRRLAESKGSPKINFEVVYIMRKPL